MYNMFSATPAACLFAQSGSKKSPTQSKKGVPHRSITDLLPPSPGKEPPQRPAAQPDAGVRYYESVDSRQQKQASVPPVMQYSSISEEEKGMVLDSAAIIFVLVWK